MRAIVLCGGLGTRLGALTSNYPKPILEVAGKPFLFNILDQLLLAKVEDIILCVGFHWEKIRDVVGDDWHGCPIKYSIESQPLGTGGAIKKAMSIFSVSDALVLNGDSYLKFNPIKLLNFYKDKNADISVALMNMENTSRYGKVVTDENCKVISFKEKQEGSSGSINTGIYYLNYSIFNLLNSEKFSFENDLLVPFCSTLNMYGLQIKTFFIDIGIPEDLTRAHLEFKTFNKDSGG